MRHLIIFLFLCGNFAQAAKPNLLFIAVDDLNDWISCLGGHPQSKTPNIDRLAEQGVLFTQAYCAAPACNPSRAATMTGIRPSTSGVYLNPQPWRPAMPEAVTLPQHFMKHGYTAIGSGKIYHGAYAEGASWDTYWPSKQKTRPGDPMPSTRSLNGLNASHFDWGPVDADDEEMGDSQVVDYVIGQLQAKHDKPFFLACGIFRPHLPWYAPKKYFDRFPLEDIVLPKVPEHDLDDVPAAGKKMADPGGDHAKVLKGDQWKKAVQGYLASIAYVDAQIGRLLEAFESSEYAKNTVVVFWTDHGWHLGEKQHWRKFALWEEAARTPMIMIAPGITSRGSRCDAPVNLIDIYPTLTELCGLPENPACEGVSLKKLLHNPDAAWKRPSITTHGKDNHAVRSQHFRYIRYQDGSEELYDHRKDANEWTNLAQHPEYQSVIAEHRKWLPEQNAENAAFHKGKKSGKKSRKK